MDQSYSLIPAPPIFPQRSQEAHKGTFGRVLIIAGSRGMSGAAGLAGLGALRGGAGLVTVAIPREIQPIVAGYEPSYLTVGLPCSEAGQISLEARAELEKHLETADAVACGPGWGQSGELFSLLLWLLETTTAPVVIDADALNLLARLNGDWPQGSGPRILTPHPGEFARLMRVDIESIQAHRVDSALLYAQKRKCTVLLKGSGTVITDGTHVAINSTGNSGMATGGAGDVLTGLIAALLAQGLDPLEAARSGAWLHGLAGDLAAAELSEPGLIASDIVRYLGKAWQQVLN